MSIKLEKGVWKDITQGKTNSMLYHISGGKVTYVQSTVIPDGYDNAMDIVGVTDQGEDGMFIVGQGEFIFALAVTSDAYVTVTAV